MSKPIVAIVAGIPGAARRVPAGRSRRIAGIASANPATVSARAIAGWARPMPVSTSPEPAARTMAFTTRARASGDGTPAGMRRSDGKASKAASPGSGASTRKTDRQPNPSAMSPAIPGPISPGTTQAVDVSASMRGLARSA